MLSSKKIEDEYRCLLSKVENTTSFSSQAQQGEEADAEEEGLMSFSLEGF